MFRRWMLPLLMLAPLALWTAGCGKKTEEAAKTGSDKGGDAKVSLPTANKPIDTRYISDDFVAAVVLHPARALESKFVKDILAEVEKEFGKQKVADTFAKVKQEAGVDPRKIEQVIVLIDKESAGRAASMFQGGGGGEPMPSVIVRFNAAVDQQAILSKISKKLTAPIRVPKVRSKDGPAFPGAKQLEKKPSPRKKPSSAKKPGLAKDSTPPKLPEKSHAGKTYHVIGPAAVCFVDDKTLLAGQEDLLKKMLTAKDVTSPLTSRLKTLGDEHDLIVAMDATPATDFLKNFPPDAFGDENAPALKYAKKIKTIAITAGISGGTLASIVLQMPSEEDAKGFAAFIQEKGVTKVRDLYAQFKNNPMAKVPPEAQFAVKLADEIVAGLKAGPAGSDVVISVPRPADLDKLPSQLGPAIKAAKKAAKTAARRNDMLQIGVAMHNFHDRYKRFPAADSNGERKGQGRKEGLSWRVYLLPYLEQKALYDQFNLDEPWDSPHNKKLISQMPAIFANPDAGLNAKDGKTAIHVFVGNNNTPFGLKRNGESVGAIIRDIVDGTSNTIMAVEAGPDKAEIWTKPGGLPFDPANNPFDGLGKIPEDGVLAVFCDGYPRTISKSVLPEMLKRLIQHNDGKVVSPDGLSSGPGSLGAGDRPKR
jgi:Protein of unknown function (DUF1559)